MKNVYFETERLVMQPLSAVHADMMYQLNQDPDVMQYTGERAFPDIRDYVAFLSAYDQYDRYRMGRFAVYLKSNNECIGWCGLKFDNAANETDLGFRIFKQHWNRGYATESAQFFLAYGFRILKLASVVAKAAVVNTASQKVLLKLGMNKTGDCQLGNLDAWKYTITKEDYRLINPGVLPD